MILKKRKAQIGFEVVKGVFIIVLVILVIAITILLTGSTMRDVADDIDTLSVNVVNITTISVVNETGSAVDGTTGLRNCGLTITSITNQSSGTAEDIANADTDGCVVLCDGCTNNNSLWNITGSYTYSSERSTSIVNNVSDAETSFFGNMGTIFSILAVVVIILAIAVAIKVVGGFSGRGGGL